MGRKSHFRRHPKHRYRGGGYRTVENWLVPTEAGEKILHVKEPQCVESGIRPFLVSRMGLKEYSRQIVERKWKPGWEVEARQGDSYVTVAMIEERPKGTYARKAAGYEV